MSGFRIRLATEADSDRIALIQRAAAEEGARYRGSRLVPTEEPREGFVLVGEADGEVLGSLGCSRTGETTWSIDRVHVLEDARGIGMGSLISRKDRSRRSRCKSSSMKRPSNRCTTS
jgi:predicted N-acetyltransferase YhbS